MRFRTAEQLPPETRGVLQLFLDYANKQSLHPNDWGDFYQFVRTAHKNRVRLSPGELQRILETSGFNHSGHISEIYEHGRRILQSDPGLLDGTRTRASRVRTEIEGRRPL